ncbi:hypothetical protein GCM10020001_086580 [Nonomuraea salmonea]
MRRPFITFLAANALSVTGNIFSILAVPWFVLETTGSAVLTGLASFATTFPIVISAAFGGTLVDRFGYRLTSVVSDLVSGLIALAVPALFLTTGLSYPLLLLMLFLRWLVTTPGETARKAMLPDLSLAAGVRIERATAAYDGVCRGAAMVGAPLAGVLILWIGPHLLLFVDGVSFLLSALLIGAGVPRVRRNARDSAGYLGDLRAGLSFLWQDRLQLSATAMVVVVNLLDTGVTQVLLALYAREVVGDPRAFGLLTGVLGGGRGGRDHRVRGGRRTITDAADVRAVLPAGRGAEGAGAGPGRAVPGGAGGDGAVGVRRRRDQPHPGHPAVRQDPRPAAGQGDRRDDGRRVRRHAGRRPAGGLAEHADRPGRDAAHVHQRLRADLGAALRLPRLARAGPLTVSGRAAPPR